MLLVRQERMRGRYDRQRSPRVPGGLDWQKHGLQPRWLGMETSDCIVALEPGFFHSQGANERDRFLAGARRRDELALVVRDRQSRRQQPRQRAVALRLVGPRWRWDVGIGLRCGQLGDRGHQLVVGEVG